MLNVNQEEKDKLGLKSLGDKNTEYIYDKVNPELLEVFTSPSDKDYYVSFQQQDEFTSLCPITKQADYASIRFIYKPDKKCVESKSLKLYLASFRNTPGFGETITNRIADDLFELLQPKILLVIGDFKPRGGIGWTTRALRCSVPFNEVDKLMLSQYT